MPVSFPSQTPTPAHFSQTNIPSQAGSHLTAALAAGQPAMRRALALDALRGLAIIGMVLSGLLPTGESALPAWMYHAQLPPPGHVYDAAVTGYTWVDFVFPLFLFALGAAIPLAMVPRLEQGVSRWKLGLKALGRGLLLLSFAVLIGNIRPYAMAEAAGHWGWLLGPAAFLLLFPVFMRLPARWPGWVTGTIRWGGWIALAVFVALLDHFEIIEFSVLKHDIIIVILANVAVSATIAWLITSDRAITRVFAMALVAALVGAHRFAPWGKKVFELEMLRPLMGDAPLEYIRWAINPMYHQYLLVALPGTLAGDVLCTWLRPGAQRLSFSIQNSRWRELSPARCLLLALTCVAIVGGAFAAFARGQMEILYASVAVGGGVGLLTVYSPPARKRLRTSAGLRGQPRISALMFRVLFTWGLIWTAVGIALLFDDGVKKDPATFSYLFLSAGLAHMVLIVLAVITDAMHRPGALFLLLDNGQNPMIAYVICGLVLLPLLNVLPGPGGSLMDWIFAQTQGPLPGLGRALGLMLTAALMVCVITRLRIFWRT